MLSGNTTTSELISEAWNFDPAIDVEQYHNRWQMAEKMARSELQSLENDITSPDLTFLKRLDRLFAFLDIQENDAGLWQNYHPEAEMRKRAEAIGLSIASLQLEITSSPSLARLLGDTSPNVLNVMGERFKAFAKRDARRAGAFLDEEDRARFRINAAELQAIGQAFQRRINEDDSHLMVEPEQLGAMPKDYKDSHPIDAATGKVRISVQSSDYFTFMEYCEDDTVKEELWKLNVNRSPENEEGLKRMIELRYQQARLLGYANFAHYSMETCMLSDPATAHSMLAEINDKARNLSQGEKRALADILAEKKTQLKAWNVPYARARLLQSRFPGFDPLSARQYFPFKSVVSEVMKLLESLFSIGFREVQDVKVWHKTVRVYDIFDNSQVNTAEDNSKGITPSTPPIDTTACSAACPRGRIYVDLITRDNKNSHPYTFPIRNSAVGSPIIPAVALGDCFGASEDACVDLDHCAALLHELGHCVHFLMAQNSEYYRFNGISVEQDFAEAPSDLLEELMQRPEIVARVAINAEGQPLPREYLEALIAGKALGKNMEIRSQTLYSLFSVRAFLADTVSIDPDFCNSYAT
jgi:thimet oligopeptidase